MKNRHLALSAAIAALAGVAHGATMMVDFDNQYFATAAPAVFSTFFISQINSTSSGTNLNVGFWNDPTLQALASPNLNVARVASPTPGGSTGPVPPPNTTKALELKFSFMAPQTGGPAGTNADGKKSFLRASSRVSTGNNKIWAPAFEVAKPLKVDVYTTRSVRMNMLIFEGDYSAAVVGQGPASNTAVTGGGVICIGGPAGSPDSLRLTSGGSGHEGGYIIPANTWTTVTFDVSNSANYTMKRLAGTGTSIITTGAGLTGLEGFGFSAVDADLTTGNTYWVFLDNIRNGNDSLISGKVTYANMDGSFNPTSAPVTVKMRDASNNTTTFSNVSLSSTGDFSFSHNLPDGTYTMFVKGLTHLQKAQSVTISGGNLTNANFTLTNGDCNNDDVVDASDYFILSDAYETFVGDSSYNAIADLNKDGGVDASDYFILSDAYELMGDE